MAAVAASVALLLAAGCGGDTQESSGQDGGNDAPEQSVPDSNQESDTSTPDASSPESTAMPTSKAAVKQELHDATVHFYETVDKAYMSGDVSSVEELRHRNAPQGGFVQDIRKMKQANQRATAKVNYGVKDLSIKRHGDDKTVDAFFTLTFGAGSVVDAQGNEVHSFEAGSSDKKVTFVREGSEWLVQRITEP